MNLHVTFSCHEKCILGEKEKTNMVIYQPALRLSILLISRISPSPLHIDEPQNPNVINYLRER